MSGIIGGVRTESGVVGIGTASANIGFSVAHGANPGGTNPVITYNTVYFNTLNCLASGVFTCPVSGKYFFSFGALTASADSRLEMTLEKNAAGAGYGSTLAWNGSSGSGNHDGSTTSAILPSNAGDLWRVVIATGAMYGNHNNNIFSAFLM